MVMPCEHKLSYYIRNDNLRNTFLKTTPVYVCRRVEEREVYLKRTLDFIKLLQYQISRWKCL